MQPKILIENMDLQAIAVLLQQEKHFVHRGVRTWDTIQVAHRLLGSLISIKHETNADVFKLTEFPGSWGMVDSIYPAQMHHTEGHVGPPLLKLYVLVQDCLGYFIFSLIKSS